MSGHKNKKAKIILQRTYEQKYMVDGNDRGWIMNTENAKANSTAGDSSNESDDYLIGYGDPAIEAMSSRWLREKRQSYCCSYLRV